MVGRPDGRLTTPMSRHHTPARRPGAERLGARLLGGEALGVGLDPVRAACSACARSVGREDAVEEAVAMALDHLRDAADVDDVGADADDHDAALSLTPCPAAVHGRAHPSHRLGKAVEDRFADQEMADIELDDFAASAAIVSAVTKSRPWPA